MDWLANEHIVLSLALRREPTDEEHRAHAAGLTVTSWTFRAVELDGAGHINNTHFWTPLEEELAAGPELESIDAEIEYRDPAMPGEVALIRDGSSLWITGAGGVVHASLLRA